LGKATYLNSKVTNSYTENTHFKREYSLHSCYVSNFFVLQPNQPENPLKLLHQGFEIYQGLLLFSHHTNKTSCFTSEMAAKNLTVKEVSIRITRLAG